jgi:hypothetical protein
MRLTYEELVDELQSRSADELVDLAEIAKRYAIEQRREEIRKNADEGMKDYLAGNLSKPTDDIDELWRQIQESE